MILEFTLIVCSAAVIAALLGHKSYEVHHGKSFKSHDMVRAVDTALSQHVIAKKQVMGARFSRASRNFFYMIKKVAHAISFFLLSHIHDSIVKMLDKMRGTNIKRQAPNKASVSFFLKHIEENK